MSSSQTIVLTLDVKELVMDFLPKMAKEYLELRNAAQELAGTEFTMTVDISGAQYSYIVKNGVDFDIREGALDAPMVTLSISLESMQSLAKMENIDMLMGMQAALSKSNYDILSTLKGAAAFELSNGDGQVSTIQAVFNGVQSPSAVFKLTMEDARAVTAKQNNPVNMFMSGALKIDGDIAFAMSFQPLLT